MTTISDFPSTTDLERLERTLAQRPPDNEEVTETLILIGTALREHAHELTQAGGPLTRQEEIARPSLARRAEHLPKTILSLAEQSDDLCEQLSRRADWDTMREKIEEFLSALHRHRNEEADVKLESIVTDIGAAD